jgi:type I restriction enzyme, S subunit
MTVEASNGPVRVLRIDEFCLTTDYVANGSFASLKENVTYRAEPDFAVLVRLKDQTNGWNGDYVFVDEHAFRFLSKSALEPGDVIVANVGNPGRTFRVPDLGRPMTLGPNAVLVRPQQGLAHRSFMFRYIQSPIGQRQIQGIVTATAQRKFNKTGLRGLKIPLPPLDEQNRIVGVLDAADALRAKRRESIEQLDTLLQSTFLDMFGDPVTNPMGWEVAPIGDCVSRLTNGYVGPTRDIYFNEGIPYLLARHVHGNDLVFDGKTFVSAEFNRKHRRSILSVGDVLLVQSGHIGESAVVPLEHEGHNCHAMIVITPVPECLAGPYLSFLFQAFHRIGYWDRIKTGISVPHLNCRDVRKVVIALPPLDLQRRFTDVVESVGQQKTLLQAHLAELDTLFASLQSRAFQGEL